jgi:UPF0716 protein FxsA
MAFLLLFVGLPLVEFFLLMEVGARLGFLPTLLLVLGTGVVGASLARQQGLGVLARMQEDLAQGRPPNRSALEAVVILLSGVVLLAPGFLTDAIGLMGLFPPTRALILKGLQGAFERATKDGRVAMGGRGPGGGMFFSGRFGGRPGGRGPGGGGSASAGPGVFGGPNRGMGSGGIRDATVVSEKDGPADEDADGNEPEGTRAIRDNK